jgi:hypothetical protein
LLLQIGSTLPGAGCTLNAAILLRIPWGRD